MPQTNTTPTDAIKRFWDRYLEYITKQGVKKNVTRWYVIRVEQYINAFPGKRIAEHRAEDVIAHLKELGLSMLYRVYLRCLKFPGCKR